MRHELFGRIPPDCTLEYGYRLHKCAIPPFSCEVFRLERDHCGSSLWHWGFLLSAHTYVAAHYKLDQGQKRHLRYDALRGVELVDGVAPPLRAARHELSVAAGQSRSSCYRQASGRVGKFLVTGFWF